MTVHIRKIQESEWALFVGYCSPGSHVVSYERGKTRGVSKSIKKGLNLLVTRPILHPPVRLESALTQSKHAALQAVL